MATKLLSKPAAGVEIRSRPYSVYEIENTIDFSLAANQLAQNDVAEAVPVPANSRVAGIRWEVKTVEGAARNFAVGDGANTSGYIATTTANTLASGDMALALTEGTPNTITGFASGKYYSVADTVDILAVTSGGLVACKIKVTVVIHDYN